MSTSSSVLGKPPQTVGRIVKSIADDRLGIGSYGMEQLTVLGYKQEYQPVHQTEQLVPVLNRDSPPPRSF